MATRGAPRLRRGAERGGLGGCVSHVDGHSRSATAPPGRGAWGAWGGGFGPPPQASRHATGGVGGALAGGARRAAPRTPPEGGGGGGGWGVASPPPHLSSRNRDEVLAPG